MLQALKIQVIWDPSFAPIEDSRLDLSWKDQLISKRIRPTAPPVATEGNTRRLAPLLLWVLTVLRIEILINGLKRQPQFSTYRLLQRIQILLNGNLDILYT